MRRRKGRSLSRTRIVEPISRSESDGRQRGYQVGYDRGRIAGEETFEQIFEGTSIVIPTYNNKEILLDCLDSIEAYTPGSHEIIIVDDGSSDGTIDVIRNTRKVRSALHSSNRGFAAAVNTGLMMAKGSTVLVMNNDVLATENWLDNMLHCLHSAPDIGAVGPVTNYIGGEQQIDVPYDTLDDMWSFAADHNVSNPEKWKRTKRLVGFCLLMPRDVLFHTGYFDEGYEVGNFEDDDWIIRLRLQGLKLVISGDTFVHHIGSATMKSLDQDKFERVNRKNEYFFRNKWGPIYEWLEWLEQNSVEMGVGIRSGLELHNAQQDVRIRHARQRSAIELFPAQVLAESSAGLIYWIDHGTRYRIQIPAGEASERLGMPRVRLSQRELSRMPLGGEWTIEESVATLEAALLPEARLADGAVLELADGRLYQLDRELLRPIMTRYTTDIWGLSVRIRQASAQEISGYSLGLPVLPPSILVSDL